MPDRQGFVLNIDEAVGLAAAQAYEMSGNESWEDAPLEIKHAAMTHVLPIVWAIAPNIGAHALRQAAALIEDDPRDEVDVGQTLREMADTLDSILEHGTWSGFEEREAANAG